LRWRGFCVLRLYRTGEGMNKRHVNKIDLTFNAFSIYRVTYKRICLIALIMCLFSCQSNNIELYGRVVDAETSEPIQGAIIYAHWTVTKGLPGLAYNMPYATMETVSDLDGKFRFQKPGDSSVNPPRMVAYKAGYTGWDHQYTFPAYERREPWVNGSELRLVKFTPNYSNYGSKYTHYEHVRFIQFAVLTWPADSIMRKAIEWEERQARKEINLKHEIEITGKVIDAKTGEPIPGAVCVIGGDGLGYTESDTYLMFLSDDNGSVSISGIFPIVNPPHLIVHKKGYITWDRVSLYPNASNLRQDFKWQEPYTFKLEKWTINYPEGDHYSFIVHRFPRAGKSSVLKTAVEQEQAVESLISGDDIPYRGRVQDARTGKPIEGAVVLGLWHEGHPDRDGCAARYYDVVETVTDNKGNFEIKGPDLKTRFIIESMNLLIFKVGYEYNEPYKWESVKLKAAATKDKVKSDSGRVIIPLKKMTLEERKKRRVGKGRCKIPDNKRQLLIKEIDKESEDLNRSLYGAGERAIRSSRYGY
jgi:hypothetical protein